MKSPIDLHSLPFAPPPPPLLLLLLLLLLLRQASASQLPYNPTQILYSVQNEKTVFILSPVSSSSWQFQLAALDLTSRSTTSSLPLTTIYSTLPFLDDSSPRSVTALLDGSGNITVITGDCSQNANEAEIWKLASVASPTSGMGLWARAQVDTQSVPLPGSSYLSSALALSSKANASDLDTRIYMFGGMCPFANSTDDTWMSAGTYYNSLLTFSRTPSVQDSIEFLASVSATRSPPVPQAGHSFTALASTFSNRTDGSQTQQKNFLLLGGQTASAFINMSQAALLSLPQETWTYVPIDDPNPSPGQFVDVEPRSGHTAVLSNDGKHLVIFGGWIGDVTTPATPQLLVLNVADAYGGVGDWQWIMPSASSSNLSPSTGLYGHGATMLPGNVMLILGGYSIPSGSTSSSRKRVPISQQTNGKSYFYNLTSNSWTSNYKYTSSLSNNSGADSGLLSKPSQKAGLGVGLALGIIAAIALGIFYLWYTRRLKRKRKAMERGMESLSGSYQPFGSEKWNLHSYGGPGQLSYGPRPALVNAHSSSHGDGALRTQPQPGRRISAALDAERTGLLLEVPSPTRGLRKSVSGRGPYAYERRVRDTIHPIAERDEEDSTLVDAPQGKNKEILTDGSVKSGDSDQIERMMNAPKLDDPFIDPLGSHPVESKSKRPTSYIPASVLIQKKELQSWVSGWERAAEELLGAKEVTSGTAGPDGRDSPDKSDRTISSLSSSSTYTTRSAAAGSSSAVTNLARTLSTRSAALLFNFPNPFANPPNIVLSSSPEDELQSPSSKSSSCRSISPERRRSQSLSSPIKEDAESWRTAKSNFSKPRAEREALLGRYHPQDQGHTRSRSKDSPSDSDSDVSFDFDRPRKSTTGIGWVGSVRRAIGMRAPTSALSSSGRSVSLTASSGMPRIAKRNEGSRAAALAGLSSPGGIFGSAPRRAASDAAFWQGKRGAKDWGEDDVDGDGEEWDVEGAAQNRVVQLMFTVPRETLRVVNADVDGGSLISFEDDKDGKHGVHENVGRAM